MNVKIVIFKTLKPVYNGQLFWSSDCPLYTGFSVVNIFIITFKNIS
jgi:hypothetical protein